MNKSQVQEWVRVALAEDIGDGDLTSQALFEPKQHASLVLRTREEGVLCGLDLAKESFLQCDAKIEWHALLEEGQSFTPNTSLVQIRGSALALLKAERVALNFLQHLSGIATITQCYVKAAQKVSPFLRIYDTRKTIPTMRILAKYAVKLGGGYNHRFSLSDGILVKDNHLAILASTGTSLAQAIPQLRQKLSPDLRIQVEVDNLTDLKLALAHQADALLLDNMPITMLRKAVQLVNKRVFTEASGAIRLHNLAEVAASGVDAISVGALTQSAPALDIGADLLR